MLVGLTKPVRLGLVALATAVLCAAFVPVAGAKVPVKFKVMRGFASPGTPDNLNVVGVLKIGDPKAKNVLVLNPGTSASAAYFQPLARTIAKTLPDWQVWSVERRENFLEDQSELNLFKQGKVSPSEFFNYYLGYLSDPSIVNHVHNVPDSAVPFAREWGMNTEINDLRVVVKAAARKGRNVAMGGHSLGGTITTAYATWDFNGRAGGRDLSGLVLIDGASNPTPITPEQATTSLNDLQTSSPFLNFGNIPSPLAGLFGMVGSASMKAAPNAPSVFQGWPLLPSNLQPPPGVNPTNEAGFGLSTDVKTSPASLRAAQVHSGQLAASGDPRTWDRAGNITPIQRWATMFSGWGLQDLDGTAWYHPMRLTIDGGAVAEGVANPAQSVLDVHSTDASKLRKSMRIYAFGAALGGARVLSAAQTLAATAHIPRRNLKLVDRSTTYAHNDPNSAEPKVNAFIKRLIPFLGKISTGKASAKKGGGKKGAGKGK
jgi:pimeloyl-ACP methyl ester carboxylesterase